MIRVQAPTISPSPSDVVVLSGDIGRHGIAIMAVREGIGFATRVESDCASLALLARRLIDASLPLHCLRDLTRGGPATALIEIAEARRIAIRLEEQAIPVIDPVRGACELLGLNPLYVANEGRFVAILPAHAAARALEILRGFNAGAAIIGHVQASESAGSVCITTLGGTRPLDLLTGEQLLRIC